MSKNILSASTIHTACLERSTGFPKYIFHHTECATTYFQFLTAALKEKNYYYYSYYFLKIYCTLGIQVKIACCYLPIMLLLLQF